MQFAGDTNRISYEEFTTLLVIKETSGKSISLTEFSGSVDLGSYLEDGDTLEDLVRQDPETSFYKLSVEDDSVFGFRNCGVDHLFTRTGAMPDLNTGLSSSINQQCQQNHLAWVLAPCGSLLASGPMGEEVQTFKTSKLARFDGSNGSTRLQLLIDGEPVSAMQIKNNTVEALYTDSGFTKQGMASRLFDYAYRLFPDLKHNDSLTQDGKWFVSRYEALRSSRTSDFEPLGL